MFSILYLTSLQPEAWTELVQMQIIITTYCYVIVRLSILCHVSFLNEDGGWKTLSII